MFKKLIPPIAGLLQPSYQEEKGDCIVRHACASCKTVQREKQVHPDVCYNCGSSTEYWVARKTVISKKKSSFTIFADISAKWEMIRKYSKDS